MTNLNRGNWVMRAAVSAALVALFMGVSTPKAEAAFMAAICDDALCSGGGDSIVADNGAGDSSALLGAIVVVGSVDGFGLAVNTSQSDPLITGMDLNWTATNFTGGVAEAWFYAWDSFANAGTYSAEIGGTLDQGFFVDAGICNDSLFGGTCVGSGTFSSSPFSSTFGSLFVGAGDYLVLGIHVLSKGKGTTTGDLRVVPEPASLVMLGMGLVGIGAGLRRRQRRKN